MARIYRLVVAITWGLGLLSMLAGVILKLAPDLAARASVTPRGSLIFAAVLFLCALATREMERATAAGGA